MKKNVVWIVGSLAIVVIAVLAWPGFGQPQRAKKSTKSNVYAPRMTVTSPSFKAGEKIPIDFTCDGKNMNPELGLANVPAGTKYLAIIMRDLDVPKGSFDHWVVWNIPVTEKIGEEFKAGVVGKNSTNRMGYTGPCPPSGEHRYRFRVYAYNQPARLAAGSTSDQLVPIMTDRALAQTELIAVYEK